MAKTSDYMGQIFGPFRIWEVIGEGAEAEVYRCEHQATGRQYVLRLDAQDETLWAGKPVIPPFNSAIEAKNAKGAWVYATVGYRQTLEARREDKDAWAVAVPAIYGVLAGRYLVPVASPVRVRHAWDVDRLFSAAPADRMYSGILQEVLNYLVGTAMVAGHSPQGSSDWKDRWGTLASGKLLIAAVADYARSVGLGDQQKVVLRLIGTADSGEPEMAENLLVRLCACLESGAMTRTEAEATLRDLHFRVNVSVRDVQQAVDLWGILKHFSSKNLLPILQFVMEGMTNQPADAYDEAKIFEVRERQPDLDQYNLFLQEYVGVHQGVITLAAK